MSQQENLDINISTEFRRSTRPRPARRRLSPSQYGKSYFVLPGSANNAAPRRVNPRNCVAATMVHDSPIIPPVTPVASLIMNDSIEVTDIRNRKRRMSQASFAAHNDSDILHVVRPLSSVSSFSPSPIASSSTALPPIDRLNYNQQTPLMIGPRNHISTEQIMSSSIMTAAKNIVEARITGRNPVPSMLENDSPPLPKTPPPSGSQKFQRKTSFSKFNMFCIRATNRGGVKILSDRSVRFSECLTEFPRIHIQTKCNPKFEHVYSVRTESWNNIVRFYCCKKIDCNAYIDFIIALDDSYNIYEYGIHHNECSTAAALKTDNAEFANGRLFASRPLTDCVLSSDCKKLTFIDDCHSFILHSVTRSSNALFTKECSCNAMVVLKAKMLWVSDYHQDKCMLKRPCNLDSPDINVIIAKTSQNEITEMTEVDAANLNSAISINQSLRHLKLWIGHVARFHLLSIDVNVAASYWNRIHLPKMSKPFKSRYWDFAQAPLIIVMTQILTGMTTSTKAMLQFFRSRFSLFYDCIGTFDGVDYSSLLKSDVRVKKVAKSRNLIPALLEFIALYLEFRLLIITRQHKLLLFGRMEVSDLPWIVLEEVVMNKYVVVMELLTP